jgi:uncharacterized membrane protein YoaK (UPF0700 family)
VNGLPEPEETPAPFALAVMLVGVAGWVDALGYLQMGHRFVSFMSGNTTQMAVDLGQGAWSEAGNLGALIGLFVLGVVAGTLVARAAGRRRLPTVLGIEAALLGAGLLLPAGGDGLPAAAVPVVLAMGWQNAALPSIGKKKVGLTYVTGTLVTFGRELADAVSGRTSWWAWSGNLTLWLAMAAGATAGAASFAWLGFGSLAIPAVSVLVLAAATALMEH